MLSHIKYHELQYLVEFMYSGEVAVEQDSLPKLLGMLSHKKSLITIFGHKHFRPKFQQKIDIFQ